MADIIASNLSESDKAALVAFKEYVNSKPFHIDVEANSDPLDPEFMRFMDFYVFDESLTSLQPLRDKYEKLPDSIKSPIHIQKTMFEAPTKGVTAQEQAQAVINLAQKYLDIDETNDGSIDETTSRALRERLRELQNNNPDINVDFNPNDSSQRSVDFLNVLIKKQAGGDGNNSDNINETLIHLWSLEQSGGSSSLSATSNDIGELFSLRNMLDLMVNTKLPSGATTSKPDIDAPWDKNWTNNHAPDFFFSQKTYNTLAAYGTVDTAVLFAETPDNPNAAILKQMARNIGIDPDKYDVFSERDVGLIAQEMLTFQARELCIEESDINNAIHRGDFMPHTNDLFLVERGFGFPDSMKDEVAKAGKVGERFLNYGSNAVSVHQSTGFATRYGSMDDEFVQERAGRSEFIRSVYESPASFYNVAMYSDPASEKTPYERRREEHYLPNLGALMDEKKIGICSDPAPSDPCAVDAQSGDSDCSINNAKAANDPCAVDAQYGESDCSQGFTSQAAVDATTSEAIETNMSDATGTGIAANNDGYDCAVDATNSNCNTLNTLKR